MTELLREKKYQLLAESNYFDKKGELKKTKEVNLFALKFCDSDKLIGLLRDDKKFEALNFLCEKGYIAPVEEGKLKIEDLDFRVSTILLEEYSSSFLDILPFLPTR
jgi:hypothetical protein